MRRAPARNTRRHSEGRTSTRPLALPDKVADALPPLGPGRGGSPRNGEVERWITLVEPAGPKTRH